MLQIKQYLAVLKNFGFTKLWISQIASQLTNYLLSFVILIRVFDLTNSSFSVGIIVFTFGLATVFFGSIAGVYSDRFDRKWILTVVNFAQAAAVLLFLFSDNFWAIVVITFIYSALNQFYLPAEAPSIPDLVPKEQILVANSYFASTGSLSLIIGFASAGPLMILFGLNGVYSIAVVLLLIAGSATLFLPPLSPHEGSLRHPFKKVWHEFKQGLAYFGSNKKLHHPFYSLISAQIINGMMITIAPAFVERLIGVQLDRNSLLIVGPLGLGILTGALMLGWESGFLTKHRQIFLGFLGMGMMITFLSLTGFVSQKMIFYLGLSYLMGIFNAHIFSPSHSLLQGHSGDGNRGRVYGSLYVALQIAATAPSIIVGLLADRVSLSLMVLGIGLITVFLGTLLKTVFKEGFQEKILS
jgi:MFS family permease